MIQKSGYNDNSKDQENISLYDDLPFWSAPFGIKLLEKIVPRKNISVLDIGFGTGFPLIELAMRLGETCKVYGMDPWQAMIVRTQEKIDAFGIRNCKILPVGTLHAGTLPVGTLHATSLQANHIIPLPDRSIDLVVSNNGLNNVDDMGKYLSECARILKPGGQLMFTMNTDDTMVEFYQVLEKVLIAHHLPDSIKAMKLHIYEKRKPIEEIRQLLAQNGFKDVEIEEDTFNYAFTDGTTMLRHHFIREAFLPSWQGIVPEDLRESIFKEIEDELNRISNKNGFFRLTIPFVVINCNT
jgi:ubiquinone/menaquinone biosynthesis C-methylase UbiE